MTPIVELFDVDGCLLSPELGANHPQLYMTIPLYTALTFYTWQQGSAAYQRYHISKESAAERVSLAYQMFRSLTVKDEEINFGRN